MSGQSGSTSLDRTGQVVGGRYRLESLIDTGGQSAVWKALDLHDGDDVAVKVLRHANSVDPASRERMFREARAMTSLVGTAAVRVYDQVWTSDGALCLVMELLHGLDFETYLIRLESNGARIMSRRLMEFMAPIVHTIEAAHGMGIVHRDLKPGNLFVLDPSFGGGVRLLDFGFAKFVRQRGFTESGFVAGSPSYIAPESWRGEQVTHLVDVYSLGAVMFRALAGQAPFRADSIGDLMQLVTSSRRPSLHQLRPDLSPRVDDWVRHALAVDPSERFQSVVALFTALRAVMAV